MKKIININKITLILFIFIYFLLPIKTQANSNCSWQRITDEAGVGGKCGTGLTQSWAKYACQLPKPDPTATPIINSGKMLYNYSICCCGGAAATTDNYTQPKFILPDIQIPIPGLALTPTSSIQSQINPDGSYSVSIPWIGEYIKGIYDYGLGVAGILAAIMLMAGGLLWLISGGDASKVTQAKELIGGSIVGLIILMSSYILLFTINPELTIFKPITVGAIKHADFQPNPVNTTEFTLKCKAQSRGACAVKNMAIFKDKANQASAICNAESGGKATAPNKFTQCTNPGVKDYAVWGLFQFNLSANKFIDDQNEILNCPAAFGNKSWTNSSPTCTVTDQTLYQKCIKAAKNPTLSIKNAYTLVGTGNNWGPWESNSKWCHFK